MNTIYTTLIILLSAILLTHCGSPQQNDTASPFPETWTVLQQEDIGAYQYLFGFSTTPDGFEEYQFFIQHNGEVAVNKNCSQHTKVVSVGEQSFLDPSAANPEIVDLNADGSLELVIQHYTGGAHCCFEYWIYSLGGQLTEIAKLETMDSPLIFHNIDDDAVYEVEGVDKTFAYWQSAYAYSPAPPVIMQFTPTGLILDFEQMRKPPPGESELATTVMRVRSELGREISPHHDEAWRHAGIPTAMWATMLDLIYTGNGNTAWEFFDRVWRNGVSGKEEFRAAFQEALQSSPYWDGIREMNGW